MNTNPEIPYITKDKITRIRANSQDEDEFFSENIDEFKIWISSLPDQQISKFLLRVFLIGINKFYKYNLAKSIEYLRYTHRTFII